MKAPPDEAAGMNGRIVVGTPIERIMQQVVRRG
jgi:hypothetical protein